jgi:hypothetical protein
MEQAPDGGKGRLGQRRQTSLYCIGRGCGRPLVC